VDNGGIFFSRGNWLHFQLDVLDTMTLICADKLLLSLRGVKECNREPLLIVISDNVSDLSY